MEKVLELAKAGYLNSAQLEPLNTKICLIQQFILEIEKLTPAVDRRIRLKLEAELKEQLDNPEFWEDD